MTERDEAWKPCPFCKCPNMRQVESGMLKCYGCGSMAYTHIWQALQSPVPEGMVLVPREPTEEMVLKGYEVIVLTTWGASKPYNVYKAMIEAAQKGVGE